MQELEHHGDNDLHLTQATSSQARISPFRHDSRHLEADAGRSEHLGNRPLLGPALVQAAHAAGRTKDPYLGERYRRLVRRHGKKRAAVAFA